MIESNLFRNLDILAGFFLGIIVFGIIFAAVFFFEMSPLIETAEQQFKGNITQLEVKP